MPPRLQAAGREGMLMLRRVPGVPVQVVSTVLTYTDSQNLGTVEAGVIECTPLIRACVH